MRWTLIAVAVTGGLWASASLAAPPPAAAFGRAPQVREAVISPDGARIAVLGGAPAARTLSIATIDQPGLPSMALGDVETVGVLWIGDYVAARVAFPFNFKGDPRRHYRLERNIVVDAQARAVSRLLSNDSASEFLEDQPILGVTDPPAAKAYVLGLVPVTSANAAHDTHIPRKGANPQHPFLRALWQVDPATGAGVLAERGGYDTQSWLLDKAGQPRVRFDVDEVTHVARTFVRAKGETVWTQLPGPDAENLLGYADPEDAVIVSRAHDGATDVVQLSLKDRSARLLWSGPRDAAVNLIWDRNRQSVVGVGDRTTVQWLEPRFGDVHARLIKALKGPVELRNWSRDGARFVVRTSDLDRPSAWYLFDAARKELSPLGEEQPELTGARFGHTRRLSYRAADGLQIPAYLTLPPDIATGVKPPLIVLPHGGPIAEDGPDFHILSQFLATRGYAVLRPQFRGSTGQGAAFQKAGEGEWGGKMQTDLLDGVAELARQGVIDPARVCIVGAGFGGYAALAGATLHADAYRCAISIGGISDLGLLGGQQLRLYGADNAAFRSLQAMLGQASSEKLAQISPLKQAARAKGPILLIHADGDALVPVAHARKMAAALTAAGKSVSLVELADDDHFLAKSSSRTKMLETVEGFLAVNLPVSP